MKSVELRCVIKRTVSTKIMVPNAPAKILEGSDGEKRQTRHEYDHEKEAMQRANFEGWTLRRDKSFSPATSGGNNNDVVALSSRNVRDRDRWDTMP